MPALPPPLYPSASPDTPPTPQQITHRISWEEPVMPQLVEIDDDGGYILTEAGAAHGGRVGVGGSRAVSSGGDDAVWGARKCPLLRETHRGGGGGRV